jgi:hypothetical protein
MDNNETIKLKDVLESYVRAHITIGHVITELFKKIEELEEKVDPVKRKRSD